MPLLYSYKVSADVADEIIRQAEKLPTEPDWVMFIANNESGLKFSIKNFIGCVGGIQFCPDVAGGTTKTIGGRVYNLDDIQYMNQVEQVKLWFQYWKDIQKEYGRFSSYHDLYLATFYPYAINQPDTYIIGIERGSNLARKIAEQNPSFDANKDLKIEKGEFKKWLDLKVYATVPVEYYNEFFKKKVYSNCTRRKLFYGQELRLAS